MGLRTSPKKEKDTSANDNAAVPEKKKRLTRAERKQAKRERKARWKEKKKTHRAELKEYYSDAPWIVRFARLYLLRAVAAACAVALCAYLPGAIREAAPYFKTGWAMAFNNSEVSDEEIHELSPIDEEGAAEIKALPTGNAEDSWAVYVYIVGSDLEDLYQDSVSELVRATSKKLRDEKIEKAQKETGELLENYLTVLEKNALEPPKFLYEPKDYKEPAEKVPREYTKDRHGSASADIEEMFVDDPSGKLDKEALHSGRV